MGTLSILIVDDDKKILELLTLGFERYGLKVLTAENGSDALDLFKREHIDLVLTDIIMPGFNGKELARRIKNESPRTRIALMTGAEEEDMEELLNNGTADYFFLKPFDINYVCKTFIGEALAT